MGRHQVQFECAGPTRGQLDDELRRTLAPESIWCDYGTFTIISDGDIFKPETPVRLRLQFGGRLIRTNRYIWCDCTLNESTGWFEWLKRPSKSFSHQVELINHDAVIDQFAAIF